jgi:pimeloyl-ACP methyl ester carboxylesterase
VPVLVVNAKDDPAAAFAAARAMSERIPGAHLLTVPRGGHLMLDNGSRVSEAIDDFLHEYAG